MKILITSVSAGAGHVRAAQAIEAAAGILDPALNALHVDVLDIVSKSFKELYSEGYAFAVKRVPTMWGLLYKVTDTKNPGASRRADRIVGAMQKGQTPALLAYLSREKPDYIITTHFLIPQLLSDAVRSGRLTVPIFSVITDYDVHKFWVNDAVSRYFVGATEIGRLLAQRGVPEDKIAVTGIPIHPVFSEKPNLAYKRDILGFQDSVPTVLFLSGGLGVVRLEKAVSALFQLGRKVQIITVSGRNIELKARLDGLKAPAHAPIRNFPFVGNIHELMDAADLVVTKPGGLTVSECLAKGKPLVMISPIPGQEQRNADFVVGRGAGEKVRGLKDLTLVLERFLSRPEALARAGRAAAETGKPGAAFDILHRVFTTKGV